MLIIDTTSAGVQKYRVQGPHVHLANKYDYNIEFALGDIEKENFYSHDKMFVHFNAAQNDNYVNMFDKFQKEGMKIIVDVDDYWHLDTRHPLYKKSVIDDVSKKSIQFIKNADYITTTTEILAKEIKKLNKNVFVLPNALDKDSNEMQLNKTTSDILRVGWSGGSSHLEDIKLLSNMGIGTKIHNAQFIMAGFSSKIRRSDGTIDESVDESVWKVYERIMSANYSIVSENYKQHLLTNDKHSQYHDVDNEPYKRVWTKSIAKYLKNMNNIDVFVAPLLDTKFNRMKSELKIIEAGFFKTPVICSDIVNYSAAIKNGSSGFLVEQKRAHKDFTKYVKFYQHNPDAMIEHGEALYEHCVQNFELSNISEKRMQFYDSI